MNRSVATVFLALFLIVAGLVAWVRYQSKNLSAELTNQPVIQETKEHLVTAEMSEASRSVVDQEAPAFKAIGHDGQTYSLKDLCREGPVVLTFVKNGCPCSQAAQPFFNELSDAYPTARFVGVIDTEADKAREWARLYSVAYPVVLDPKLRIVRDYHVENSAYVVVIDREGRIRQHWPGYSTAMLTDLGTLISNLSNSPLKPIDIEDAPDQLYTGCPFDL